MVSVRGHLCLWTIVSCTYTKAKRSPTFIVEGDRGRERAGGGRTGGGKQDLYEGGKQEQK